MPVGAKRWMLLGTCHYAILCYVTNLDPGNTHLLPHGFCGSGVQTQPV